MADIFFWSRKIGAPQVKGIIGGRWWWCVAGAAAARRHLRQTTQYNLSCERPLGAQVPVGSDFKKRAYECIDCITDRLGKCSLESVFRQKNSRWVFKVTFHLMRQSPRDGQPVHNSRYIHHLNKITLKLTNVEKIIFKTNTT